MHPGMAAMMKGRVKKLIAFGESRNEIIKYFSNEVDVVEKEQLKQAAEMAYEIAEPGDTVLLSPGGSSFDEFKDYCDRGDKFTQWVVELAKK
jgi:UDP-N-acetylmuramoylalanine--D-glutamate ligase